MLSHLIVAPPVSSQDPSEHANHRISMRAHNALYSADPGVPPWPARLWRPKGSAVAGSSDLGLWGRGSGRGRSRGLPPVLCGTDLARSDAGLLGGHRGRVSWRFWLVGLSLGA